MNLALSLKFWLGALIGAALATLLLHGAQALGSAHGLAGLCLGTALGFVGLVALITVRNRWATGAELED
jgi:hypothetical protein